LKQAAWLAVGRIPGGKEPHHSRFAALPRQKQPLLCRHDAQVANGRIRRPFPIEKRIVSPARPCSGIRALWAPSNEARCTLGLTGFLATPGAIIRISCRDVSATRGKILFNTIGNSKEPAVQQARPY
jgi:hypothetical protein